MNMIRLYRLCIVLLCAWLGMAQAVAQFNGCPVGFCVKGPAAASYTGPGDVSVNGSTSNWFVWYSCARVFKASLANTSTNLCDLVDSSAPTVVICTLRGTTSGTVDLAGTYCTGGVTPATKCAAATGGVCNISQAYDQTGGGNPVVNVTAAQQPFLTFSALSGLPSMQCTAATCDLATSATFTFAQPITESGVYIVPTNVAGEQPFIAPSANNNAQIGVSGTANLAMADAGTQVNVSATLNAWHALQGLLSGAACALNIDGTDTGSLNCGAGGFSTASVRLMRGPGLQVTGSIMEAGLLKVTSSSADRNNIRANQKAIYTTLP
jgi:hypothetical protein